MTTPELIQWLRDNSSGVYRPAAEAAEVIEQLQRERDEARKETFRTREFMDYGFAKAQEELATVTAQRDRLADSLCSVFNLIDEDPQSAKDLAETTLQSLTPKTV
jgi:hypothetical protein